MLPKRRDGTQTAREGERRLRAGSQFQVTSDGHPDSEIEWASNMTKRANNISTGVRIYSEQPENNSHCFRLQCAFWARVRIVKGQPRKHWESYVDFAINFLDYTVSLKKGLNVFSFFEAFLTFIWTYFCETQLWALWREPRYAFTLIGLMAHVSMHTVPFDRNTLISTLKWGWILCFSMHLNILQMSQILWFFIARCSPIWMMLSYQGATW